MSHGAPSHHVVPLESQRQTRMRTCSINGTLYLVMCESLAFMLSGRKGLTSQFVFSFTSTFCSSISPALWSSGLAKIRVGTAHRPSWHPEIVAFCFENSVSRCAEVFPWGLNSCESRQWLSWEAHSSGLRALPALTTGFQGGDAHALSTTCILYVLVVCGTLQSMEPRAGPSYPGRRAILD